MTQQTTTQTTLNLLNILGMWMNQRTKARVHLLRPGADNQYVLHIYHGSALYLQKTYPIDLRQVAIAEAQNMAELLDCRVQRRPE